MDIDSRLLASEEIPVFTFLLTQPTSFSLSSLFTISLAQLPLVFAKTAFGAQPPRPLGDELLMLLLGGLKTVLVAGVGHGDDLGFLFPMSPPGFPKMITTAAQRKTRANLLELLESFSHCGMPKLGGVELWERVGGNGTEEYLEIGETVKMVAHPTSFTEQLHFWKQVNTLSVSSLYFQYIHNDTPKTHIFSKPYL